MTVENKRTFLDHTADVLFVAQGSTLEKLFEQAALALFETQTDLEKIDLNKSITITVENKNLEYLLFDFLNDLLVYKDSDLLFFKKFEINIKKQTDKSGKASYYLTAICHGEVANDSKHDRKLDVKAITLHMFEVKQKTFENNEMGWTCQVLLDI